MMDRKNDWLAAQLNAPVGVELADFYANGITPDNTGIQDRDYYKNIPQVKEAFNKDGEFDEKAYNQFYDSAIRSYNEFSDDKFIDDYVKTASRHKYDWFNIGAPVMDTSVIMMEASDKNRHSQGLGNIWQKGDPVFSDREVAQANYVRDEHGNVLDWTPNDKGGIFKSIFAPTLALAIWESDGEHMEHGQLVQHRKGELKLDESGDPYTEILGNRESYGRDVVKWSDVLTEEGSWWNKIDPFDSDGLEKGIGRTVAETALKIAPFFIPGAGPWLGALSAAKALAGVVPTMAKGVAGIVSDNDETVFGQSMTKWENFMQKFSDSTSDAGRGSFWSPESLGNIVSSSFGQLASQKVVAKIPKLLNPSTKNTELGRQLALGYMAVTSSTDSYSAFKEAGANDTVAGIGMIATMVAMYGLMNVEYFKEWLFKDTWLDEEIEFRKSFKEYIKHNAKELFGETPEIVDPTTLRGKLHSTKLYTKFYNPIKTFISDKIINSKYIGGSVVANRMLNEGLEETAEEGVMDAVKALALGADALGFKVTEDPNTKLDFGFSAKDFLSRYSSAFIGGAIGGAVFEGYNNWENYIMGTTNKISDIKDLDERMIWYMRNGYTDRMLNTLDKAYEKHELPGNKNLSAIKFEDVKDLENPDYSKRVYAQGSVDDNQEKALYNIVRTRIKTMKDILDEHIILYSDKETVRNVFHQKGVENIEKMAKEAKMSVAEFQSKYFYDEEIEALREAGLLKDVINDAQKLSMYIFDIGVRLRKAKSELDLASDENKASKSKAVEQLESHMKMLKKQYEALMNGENAGKYIANAGYTVNGPLMEGYLNRNGDGFKFFPQTDVAHFAKWKYGLNYNDLSDIHKEAILSEFQKFAEKDMSEEHLRQIRELHYALTSRFSEDINKIKEAYKDYKSDPYRENDLFLNTEMREQNLQLLDLAILTLETKQRKSELNEEEQQQLELFKYQKGLLENEETLVEFESSLSEKGEKELGKWLNPSAEMSDSERDNYKNFIRNFYTKLANDKIISPYEGALFSRYLELETNPMKSWDLVEVARKIEQGLIEDPESGVDIEAFYIDTNVLAAKAKSFWEEVSTNPKNARNTYNALIEYVKDKVDTGSYSSEDFVNALLGTNPNLVDDAPSIPELNAVSPVNIGELLDFIDEINGIRQNIKESSVHELLSKLSFIVHGRELEPLEVLKREVSDLRKTTNPADYVVDPNSLEELRTAKHVVQMAMSLIQTAADGTNAKINKYQKEKFAEIDLSQGNLFIRDLGLIYSKLSKLIELAENNEQSLIDEQQDIAVNMLPKMIKSIVNPSIDDDDEKLVSMVIDEMFIEAGKEKGFVKSLWKEYNLDNITKDSYKNFYAKYLEFASALRSAYLEVVEHHGGNKAFGKKLASKISGLSFKSSKFTSRIDEQISAFDSLVFFMTLAGADTLEFERKFKAAATKETKLLPYFAQEFAVHCAWARVHNEELFDGFIDGLKLKGNSDSKYIDEMTKLSRFTIVDGSGGTGKSTGVAKFLWNILKDEGYDILVVSNDKDRANALKETLGVGDEVVKTTADALKSILGKDYQLSDFASEDKNGHYVLQDKDLSDKTIKNAKLFTDASKNKKLLVIDEITLLDEMELQILSEYAKYSDDKVSILGLGDSKQNAKKVVVGGSEKTSGIEDCVYIKTPSLTASLRKTCRGKKLNLNVVGTIVSALNDWREDNLDEDDRELSKQAQNIINAFAADSKIQLAYAINENGLFGEMFSEDPKSHIEMLVSNLKDGEKLAILVDDAGHSEYSDVKEKYGEKVEVLNSAQIQGGQFKYVIVDKKFDENPDNKRATLKDFYTAISRSTTGTVIGTKKSDIRKIFGDKIEAVERHDAAALIVNPEDERYNKIAQKYRDWRTELFGLVSGETSSPATTSTPPTPGTTPEPEPDPDPVVTGDGVVFDEIKKKISQPRKEEGVTEQDVYNEHLDPNNRNKHAEQYRIRESEKAKTDVIDSDLLYEWFDSSEDFGVYMPQFDLDSDKESDIDDFKTSVKVFSSVLFEGMNSGEIPSGVINNIKIESFRKQLLNPTGFLEWVANDSGSTLFYCYEEDGKKYVIPVARSLNILNGTIKIDGFKRITNIIPISSKGRIQKRIKDTCGTKIPSWKTLGVFVGDKTGFSNIRNMGWGKAFVPLMTWGEWHSDSGRNFFRVQELEDGSKWAWQGYNEDPKHQGVAMGIQKSIDFNTFLELCKHVRTIKRRASDLTSRKDSAEVLSKFFGVSVDPTQYSNSMNADEAAEKNAQEIKNSEITLLWKTRVSSLITSMVRYFDGESDTIKNKFFERLIKLAPENSSGNYKSGFTVTLPTKSGAEDLEFFLENTSDGFKVFQYSGITGKYEGLGITLDNFSKSSEDGYGLGIINIYSLVENLISAVKTSSTDLLDVNGITANNLVGLSGEELRATADALFEGDLIRFGVKTRYTNPEGESKYYVPNEAFIVGDLLEANDPFDSHVISKLSKFIDTETVFKHGIYCNIRSDKQVEGNTEWRYRDLDSEEEQSNYVWDIIDIKLPLYRTSELEASSVGEWGKYLKQFSTKQSNSINGIYEEYSFKKEDGWLIPIRDGERHVIDIKSEIGDDWVESHIPDNIKGGFIDAISIDGKHARIVFDDFSMQEIELKTPVDTSNFAIKSIVTAISSTVVDGINYELVLKDDKLKFIHQDSEYDIQLGYSDGNTIEVFSNINKKQISTKLSIKKLPDSLKPIAEEILNKFGTLIGKHEEMDNSWFYFKKDGSYYYYDSDLGLYEECVITRSNDKYYIFNQSGSLHNIVPVNSISETFETKPKLTSGSYLETSDNKTFKVVGNLRLHATILMSITEGLQEISNNEYEITEIDVQNKTIKGSFGELRLTEDFTIDNLDLDSSHIKTVNGSEINEFIKKLQENPTLKRIFGTIPDIESESINDIISNLNGILSEMRYDLGKWWTIEYKNNRVSVASRRDSETLLGKELKELGIEDISDIEIVSGKEGWKYKEIVVTLSNSSKLFLELTKNRKSDKWDIKEKNVEESSKEGVLEVDELQNMLDSIKSVLLPDGSNLISNSWIQVLEAKIDSIHSGKDVDDVYNNFVIEFAEYMALETTNPNYQQTIEILTPLLTAITEADTTKTCKV